MAALKAPRKARIAYAFGFQAAFKDKNAAYPRFVHPTIANVQTTDLGLALEKFIESKSERPPAQLLAAFKDHQLKGKLSAYKECHLQGDVLLIYTDKDDTVNLLVIANHDELHGPREKSLLKRLKEAQDTILLKPWKNNADVKEIRQTLQKARPTRAEIEGLMKEFDGHLSEIEQTALSDYLVSLPGAKRSVP